MYDYSGEFAFTIGRRSLGSVKVNNYDLSLSQNKRRIISVRNF